MNKIAKHSIRSVIFIVVAFVLLLAAEVIVNHHDIATSHWTRPGALKESGAAAIAGLNCREFNEIRFRPCDMSLYLIVKKVGVQEALLIPESIHGTINVKLNGDDYCAFTFKLAESSVENKSADDADDSADNDNLMDFDRRVDRDYIFGPATEADADGYAKLTGRSFGMSDKLRIDIDLQGPVPRTSTFLFVYRRAPKSVLHGTFLQPLGDYALSLFPKNIFK